MKNINFKGIIIGIIIMFILDVVSSIAMIFVFSENRSVEGLQASSRTTITLIFTLVFGAISTIVAGYIAAKYGKTAPYKNALVIGVLGACYGIFLISDFPMWFNVIGFIAVIPAALFGGYLIARKSV